MLLNQEIDGVRHIAGQRFKIEEGEFPIISVPGDLILPGTLTAQTSSRRKAAKDFIGRVIEYQAADGQLGCILPYHNRHYSSVWIRSAATGSQTLLGLYLTIEAVTVS